MSSLATAKIKGKFIDTKASLHHILFNFIAVY